MKTTKEANLLQAALDCATGNFPAWRPHAEALLSTFGNVDRDVMVQKALSIIWRVAKPTHMSGVKLAEAVLPFIAGLYIWAQHACPHFAMAPDFFMATAVTDFGDPPDEPLALPFPAFTLAFPPLPLLGNATRAFVYPLAKVDGLQEGEHVSATTISWPFIRITLLTKDRIFSQWPLAMSQRELLTTEAGVLDKAVHGQRPLEPGEETQTRALRRVLANVLAYINTKGPLPTRTPERHAPPAPLERVRPDRSTFDVGRSVKLDGGLRHAFASSGGIGARWKLAQRFIVRGHWRWQVHGEGRALRRHQWIEPFYKGPEDVEAALQRTYEVGSHEED